MKHSHDLLVIKPERKWIIQSIENVVYWVMLASMLILSTYPRFQHVKYKSLSLSDWLNALYSVTPIVGVNMQNNTKSHSSHTREKGMKLLINQKRWNSGFSILCILVGPNDTFYSALLLNEKTDFNISHYFISQHQYRYASYLERTVTECLLKQILINTIIFRRTVLGYDLNQHYKTHCFIQG